MIQLITSGVSLLYSQADTVWLNFVIYMLWIAQPTIGWVSRLKLQALLDLFASYQQRVILFESYMMQIYTSICNLSSENIHFGTYIYGLQMMKIHFQKLDVTNFYIYLQLTTCR